MVQTYYDDNVTKGDIGVIVMSPYQLLLDVDGSERPMLFYGQFEVIGNIHDKEQEHDN